MPAPDAGHPLQDEGSRGDERHVAVTAANSVAKAADNG
jgi:hypothetical protein